MSRARHSSRDIEFDLPGALDDMAGLASKAAIGHGARDVEVFGNGRQGRPLSASPATCSRRLRPARRTPWLLYRPTTQAGSCCLPPSTQSSARFASPPATSHHGTPSPGLAHLLHAAGHPSWQGDRLEDARRLRRLWRRRVRKGDGAARQLASCTAHAHARRPPQVSPQKLCPVALTAGGSRGDSRAGTAAATIFSHRRALRAGCACSSRTSSCRTSPTSTLRCSRTTAAARRSRLAR